MNISLSPFAPENLVSRDGFGSPVRVSLLISMLRLNLVLAYGIPPEFRGDVHLFILNRHTPSGQPEFIGSRNCVPLAFPTESSPAHWAASKPQGSSERVLLPWSEEVRRGDLSVDILLVGCGSGLCNKASEYSIPQTDNRGISPEIVTEK